MKQQKICAFRILLVSPRLEKDARIPCVSKIWLLHELSKRGLKVLQDKLPKETG